MKDYISVFKNTISKQKCEELIRKFEENLNCHEYVDVRDNHWNKQFTQINFNNHKEFEKENEELKKLFINAIQSYKKVNDLNDVHFPKSFIFEPIRMKRYLPNSTNSFDEHVDVSDLQSARRFLVMFIYLSDDFDGGETVFTEHKKIIKPKIGNMLLFPPLWTHPHFAQKVSGKEAKYIVGTYMHYV